MANKSNPVRQGSEMVMEGETYVQFRENKVPEFCQYIVDNYEFEMADWDAPVFPSVNDHSIEEVVDFFVVGNSVNYCFNNLETGEKFAHEFMGNNWDGAFGMWASLMGEFQTNNRLLDSEYLKVIDEEEVADIFEPCNGVEIPMLESRVESLQSVGELIEEVGGTFWNLFDDQTVNLYGDDGVVSTLAEADAYEDARLYGGDIVRFDKRAQLAVSMLYGKLHTTQYEFEIEDMKEFTVFADYGIPAGLASHGVIEYGDTLSQKIESQEVIPENSPEEVEIRSATVVAVDKISEYLDQNFDVPTKMPVLDYVLWCMRREADTNVHLTETTAY